MVSVWPLDGRRSEGIAQEYRLVLPDFQSAGRVLLQLVWPLELWVMNSNSLIGRNCLNYAPLHKALHKRHYITFFGPILDILGLGFWARTPPLCIFYVSILYIPLQQ